jgi:predicted metal-dependent hydrolase
MNLSCMYGNSKIEFVVKYRNRATLAIQITAPGVVTVLSPEGLSPGEIKSRVEKKAGWIAKKLVYFKKLGKLKENRRISEGGKLLYLGKSYPVVINYNKELKWLTARLSEDVFVFDTPVRDPLILKKLAEKWYRRDAEKIILQRVEKYSHKFNISPLQIKVKEQKRRWGTCTSQRNIYFNWRIIMAPMNVIDYVIVHELSHLVYQDHSKQFWGCVEAAMPDYRERKKWLKENGLLLEL